MAIPCGMATVLGSSWACGMAMVLGSSWASSVACCTYDTAMRDTAPGWGEPSLYKPPAGRGGAALMAVVPATAPSLDALPNPALITKSVAAWPPQLLSKTTGFEREVGAELAAEQGVGYGMAATADDDDGPDDGDGSPTVLYGMAIGSVGDVLGFVA